MFRIYLIDTGRILGEGILSNSSIPGLKFVVQAEDCSATATGTVSVATSSKLVQRLAQGAFAKVGVQYQSDKMSTEFSIDAVNGPTLLGSTVVKIKVRILGLVTKSFNLALGLQVWA